MILFVLILVIFLGLIFGNWYLNEKAPEEQMEAILKKKKKVSQMDANGAMYNNYFLIFEVKGELKKFKVSKRIYKQYNESEKGVLSFKRKRFVNFILV